MTSGNAAPNVPVLQACMVTRDPAAFGLLVEDLNDYFGSFWGELTPSETQVFLTQPDGRQLACLIVSVDDDDRSTLQPVKQVITQASAMGMPVLIVTEALSPDEVAALMACGARAQITYPLDRGALSNSLRKMVPGGAVARTSRADGGAMTCVVQGLAGGTGATTLATTLADELALLNPGQTCLLDLDLQFGSCDRSLGLKPGADVHGILMDPAAQLNRPRFCAALQSRPNGLQVWTNPGTIIPHQQITPAAITRLVQIARAEFDFVIIDMPHQMTPWSDDVLIGADMVFCPLELDARSTQAATRFLRHLGSAQILVDELWFAVNRLPKTADPAMDVHLTRLGDVLQSPIDLLLPDEGRAMTIAANRGRTLSECMSNALYRLEVQALAQNITARGRAAELAA